MAGQVVYKDARRDGALEGTLFAGKKFWLSRAVPMRSSIQKDIEVGDYEAPPWHFTDASR